MNSWLTFLRTIKYLAINFHSTGNLKKKGSITKLVSRAFCRQRPNPVSTAFLLFCFCSVQDFRLIADQGKRLQIFFSQFDQLILSVCSSTSFPEKQFSFYDLTLYTRVSCLFGQRVFLCITNFTLTHVKKKKRSIYKTWRTTSRQKGQEG